MKKRELMEYMKEQGFTLYRESGSHYIFRDKYSQFVAPKTPSCPRAYLNMKSDLRKLTRKREELDILKGETVAEPRKVVIVNRDQPPVLYTKFSDLVHLPLKSVPDPVEEKPKTIEEMKLRMIDLFAEGKVAGEIAKILTAEGFRSSTGTPIRHTAVGIFAKQLGLNQTPEPATKVAEKETPVITPMPTDPTPKPMSVTSNTGPQKPAPSPYEERLPEFALAILRDKNLSADKKVRLLLVYVDEV